MADVLKDTGPFPMYDLSEANVCEYVNSFRSAPRHNAEHGFGKPLSQLPKHMPRPVGKSVEICSSIWSGVEFLEQESAISPQDILIPVNNVATELPHSLAPRLPFLLSCKLTFFD